MKILLRDPKALSYFNLTPDGFWNSFRAIWIVLVPYLFSLLNQRSYLMSDNDFTLETFPSALFFSVKLIGIALEWVLMPILLWLAADLLGIKTRYGAFIIARNWASVIVAWMFFVPMLAHLSGLIILEVMLFAQFLLLGVVLVYGYRVARQTLEKPVGFCIALIGVDFLIGLIVGEALWSTIAPTVTTVSAQ